jgi:hypothetical protein
MALAAQPVRPYVPGPSAPSRPMRAGPHPRLMLVRETPPAYGAEPAAVAAATPPPATDLDRIEELGDRIATLSAHIEAATHDLLVMIADFDACRGWEASGQKSCAHWLAFRTGVDLGAARERVRTAHALMDLPETRAAMARGELSFSKVRALSRVARADNEGNLLELARGCTAAQLERVVRGWKRAGTRKDEAELELERREARTLSIFPDLDGMYVVRGKLPPELGVLLMRAIEAASDQIYREQPVPELETEHAAAQRRADALALLAERAMAAGLADDAPVSGTRAARYQVVLHVEESTLQTEGDAAPCGDGRSDLEDGTRVAAETSRRLSCDAGVVRMRHAPGGEVLDVGHRTRTVPPAIRRALEARDRGCRFPGCGSRFTDAHHVRHWADGGETSLRNTLLLCTHHHTLVHEGGWTIEWWGEGRPAFHGPQGQVVFEGRWQSPELPADPVEALVAGHHARGTRPDWATAGARWKSAEEIPIEVMLGAAEALLASRP